MVCNHSGKRDVKQSTDKPRVNYSHGDLKIGCEYRIALKPINNTRHLRRCGLKNYLKPVWDSHVIIDVANTIHTNGCTPNVINCVISASRSGMYSESIPENVIYAMCHHIESGNNLTSSVIKNFLRPHWPSKKIIKSSDVFNIKVKIRRLLPKYRNCNKDYNLFKKNIVSADFLHGIDNHCDVNDDEAYELAQSFWNEVSSNNKSENEAIFSFIEFLQLIKSHAKGFSFELAQADDYPNYCGKGKARNATDKELLGVVWMTATMRRNLELFGSFLCFDMMLRGINTPFWRYVGIAITDEVGKL